MNDTANIKKLLDFLDETQWNYKPKFSLVQSLPITTRDDLRKMTMEHKSIIGHVKTSGSTGEQLTIGKTYLDRIWGQATNIRELKWRKWDMSKNLAVIKPDLSEGEQNSWGISPDIAPKQGIAYTMGYQPISVIQKWLEETNPHYIHAPPSIIEQLDLSKIPNYLDHKGTGELGGSSYSSEECGTIALQCPDNPSVMHVMENQIVEVGKLGELIITCLTNPYIKRYQHGDSIELGECHCGRTLQTIKKINGRIRNMFDLPNGDKKWPMIGTRDYYSKYQIKRFKAIQTALDTLELSIIRDEKFTLEEEKEFAKFVNENIKSPLEIKVIIHYVNDFPVGKFEEFISLVTN